MFEPPLSSPLEETVVIVGVGLIGGSLAAAVKQRKVARRVIGVGRNAARVEAARVAGLIDEAVIDIAEVIDRATLVVFCTPVDRVVDDVRSTALAISTRLKQSLRSPEPLLTDVGSVKGPICNRLEDVNSFIGSHPIAGSHRHGFEAADARLFEGRMCVLTPLESSSPPLVDRLERFWQAIGMQTARMSPVAHDESLAMTSHLPHVVAAALAATLSDQNRALTGSGFRDTTRIAAGDPELWTGILLNNAQHVISGIDDVQQRLAALRTAIAAGDIALIREFLAKGQRSRASLDKTQQGLDQNVVE